MAWLNRKPRASEDVVSPTRADEETSVIPIRGKAPVFEPVLPPRPTPSRPSVPVQDRPWQLLVVPPTPGAPTRAFHVRRWQAKLALWAVGLLMLIATADVVAIIATLRGEEPVPTAAEEAELRNGLIAVEDSLALLHAQEADAREFTADSLASLAIAGPKGRERLLNLHRRSLLNRGRGESSRSFESVPAGALEGLPVVGGAIASGFSYARRHPLLHIIRPHLGVDVAAAYGSRITSPAAGTVTYVGRRFGYGLMLEIEHAGGVVTRYAHASSVLVHDGQTVSRGTLLATVGSSGLTTGPHLHYEVLVNGHNVDPLRFKMPQQADSAATMQPASSQPESAPASTNP